MRTTHKAVLSVVLGVVLAGAGVQAANAAAFYDNINYDSHLETRTSGNLTNSDKASSIRNTGYATYCENNGCVGRTVKLYGDYNDLRAVSTNLHLGETWSDRISAVK